MKKHVKSLEKRVDIKNSNVENKVTDITRAKSTNTKSLSTSITASNNNRESLTSATHSNDDNPVEKCTDLEDLDKDENYNIMKEGSKENAIEQNVLLRFF